MNNVLRAYGMSASQNSMGAGTGFDRTTWTMQNASLEVMYINHSYNGNTYEGHMGHCFPTLRSVAACDAQTAGTHLILGHLNHRCCGAFTWTDTVLEFFQRNPCAAGTTSQQYYLCDPKPSSGAAQPSPTILAAVVAGVTMACLSLMC